MSAKKLNNKSNVIGKNVKYHRTRLALTQEQVCQKLDLLGLNLYHSDIYLIEHNKRIVKDYEAFALSKVFNISLDELYKGAELELQ